SRAHLLIRRPIESALVMGNTAPDKDWVARTVTITRRACRNAVRSAHREPWNTFLRETARARLATVGADHLVAIWTLRAAGVVTRDRAFAWGSEVRCLEYRLQSGSLCHARQAN